MMMQLELNLLIVAHNWHKRFQIGYWWWYFYVICGGETNISVKKYGNSYEYFESEKCFSLNYEIANDS